MNKIEKFAFSYVRLTLIEYFFQFIIWLNLNKEISNCLNLFYKILIFPKDIIDLILEYTSLGNYVLIICIFIVFNNIYQEYVF